MRRFLLWSLLVLALAGALWASALSLPKREGASAAAVTLRQAQGDRLSAPSFTLPDQTGQSFLSDSLKGRVWIADFIFTSCAGTCPGMSAKMALLQQRLPPDILLVSFSVDPKRDTPPVLAEYARWYGAKTGRWFFLTGTEEEIRQIAQRGFRLSVAEGGGPDEPIIHSVRFVLVDPGGEIRGYYDSNDPAQLEQLVSDAGTVLGNPLKQ